MENFQVTKFQGCYIFKNHKQSLSMVVLNKYILAKKWYQIHLQTFFKIRECMQHCNTVHVPAKFTNMYVENCKSF